ncbi:MAG: thioredoxin family protein [Bacteroidota bacterium]|nr:thioredoxin family protein [Bacteroidota bacterium]
MICSLLWLNLTVHANDGYKVGDIARDFRLKNVDGTMISLKSYPDAKGIIVIFTCNHCPYAKAYESRIIALHKNFAPQGYPVVAINPNDPAAYPEDSFENMVKRAKEKAYPFAYLVDETQEVAKAYGATKTPHVFLLKRNADTYEVAYIGAIDDNSENAQAVKEKYVEKAIEGLTKGTPYTTTTKAVGCSIKWKK